MLMMRTILVSLLVVSVMKQAQSQVSVNSDPPWAIVVHGGAGGDPSSWDEAKIQARKEGLARALAAGRDSLATGGAAIDVVEQVIRLFEDDAAFNAGRGAVLTREGKAELDASIMDGKSRGCGAVAGVTRVKNPISLARRVMTETPHVLLAGNGADEFARQQKLPLVDPDYFLSRLSRPFPAGGKEISEPHFGTVGCVVLDQHGNLAAGTSTGGTSKKLPGRVGDSPIVGAGTYAANDTCAVSGTGVGEEYIRNSVAYDVAAQMRYANRSLELAVHTIMRERLQPGIGGLIAVSHRGEIVMQHNTPGMSCGAANSDGRFDTYLAVSTEQGAELDEQSAEQELESIIEQQATDWNAGDIDAFMKVYWRSDALTFSSGGAVTRGFDATLARYKRRYPSRDQMGKVQFSELEFLPLGTGAMQALGVWNLQRESDPIGGRFTLVFRRFPEGWRIVHDHTSTFSDPPNGEDANGKENNANEKDDDA